jgi:hypothetical protein
MRVDQHSCAGGGLGWTGSVQDQWVRLVGVRLQVCCERACTGSPRLSCYSCRGQCSSVQSTSRLHTSGRICQVQQVDACRDVGRMIGCLLADGLLLLVWVLCSVDCRAALLVCSILMQHGSIMQTCQGTEVMCDIGGTVRAPLTQGTVSTGRARCLAIFSTGRAPSITASVMSRAMLVMMAQGQWQSLAYCSDLTL